MSELAESRSCPHCGSTEYAGGLTSAVRTCRDCGARYRPPESAAGRTVVAVVLVGAGLIGLVIAGFGLALALDAPPNDPGAVAAGLMCMVVFGIASAAALIFGIRQSRPRPAAAPGDTQPVRLGRLVPADRAISLARAIAEDHRAANIVKNLAAIRPDRVANARAHFARTMTDDETALVIVDTSFFKNGKSGLLLTNRAIYSTLLPRPIMLDAIRVVTHRPPDRRARVMLHVAVALMHFFPPAALLMLPVAVAGRDKHKNSLLVNDKLVFRGDKNLTWAFWVDALPALSDELFRPRLAGIEVVPAEGDPLRTTDPDWDTVKQVIRSLNADTLRVARLWAAGRSTGLEIAGGDGRYTVRQLPAGWAYRDPAAGDELVELYPGHRVSVSAVCTDLRRVIEVAREFATTGAVL